MTINQGLLGLTLSSLLSSGATLAADFNKGIEAYESGDYKTAMAEWTPLAEQGNAKAQDKLGIMYEKGLGVLENDRTASSWYVKAAKQGDANAQYNLARMYHSGQYIGQWTGLTDYVRAYMWYNLASYNGSEQAPENKEELSKQLTSDQLQKAQYMSSLCLERQYEDCWTNSEEEVPISARLGMAKRSEAFNPEAQSIFGDLFDGAMNLIRSSKPAE
jgi:TPR repeat protein